MRNPDNTLDRVYIVVCSLSHDCLTVASQYQFIPIRISEKRNLRHGDSLYQASCAVLAEIPVTFPI
jgi:hypothetical protein